jgi:hypothetical protein
MSDEHEDTGRIGDQTPIFKKLSPDEELGLLLSQPSGLPDHALDTAPVNSKIVVTTRPEGPGRIAVMATPDGARLLPEGDAAHRLPIGTKVFKLDDGRFCVKLPAGFEAYAQTVFTCGQAAEAIAAANTAIQEHSA